MAVIIGGYDHLKMIEAILNALINKGILSKEEAQVIINSAKVV